MNKNNTMRWVLGALALTLAACGSDSAIPTPPVASSSASSESSQASEASSSSEASEQSSSSEASSESSSSEANEQSSSSEASESSASSEISSSSEQSVSSVSSSSSSSLSSISSSVSSSSSSSISSSSSESSSSSSEAAVTWELVWSDEFEGEAIDATKWEHEVNCWGGGNEEAQCYTDNPANSYVQDGILYLEARQESVCGPAHNQEDPAYNPDDTSVCRDYSSARLRTRGMGDWTFGRMEVRARMPNGQGMWPAIWMLPTDTVYGGWPHSGEIDIFEAFSPGTANFDPLNTLHGTLHYGFSWPWNQYSGAQYIPDENIWDEFYTYAVEWEEGEIRWYIDDVHFATNSGNWFSYFWGGQEVGYQVSSGSQPFDQPFHMILNLAIGSPWLGYPDETNTFPQQMAVEYVRVYECSVDPGTGKGCATVGDPEVTPINIAGHVAPPDEREVLYMFQNGVVNLDLEGPEGSVESGLTPGFWELAGGNVISNPAYSLGEEVVWDIQFNGVGNAFLISEDGLNFGDNVNSRAKNLGEFKFDLRVLSIDPDTRLRIKIDSGWPELSFHEIEIPPTGEWSEVAVRLYSMRPNDGEWWGPVVDYTHVLNPFVIEPVGGNAHVQLNNIRLVCLAGVDNCDVKPVEPPVALTEDFDIFIDAVDPLWGTIGQWGENGGHVQVNIVDADDPERGQVFDGKFTMDGPNGLMFIQTPPGIVRDVSAFNEGYLVFDILVLDYGTNTTGLVVQADCVNPCTSGAIPIGVVGDGDWETVVVPVASMLPGLNLTQVNTPFALLPTWGDQNGGIHIQVDNVRWVLEDPEL